MDKVWTGAPPWGAAARQEHAAGLFLLCACLRSECAAASSGAPLAGSRETARGAAARDAMVNILAWGRAHGKVRSEAAAEEASVDVDGSDGEAQHESDAERGSKRHSDDETPGGPAAAAADPLRLGRDAPSAWVAREVCAATRVMSRPAARALLEKAQPLFRTCRDESTGDEAWNSMDCWSTWTPLHWAAQGGWTEVVATLLHHSTKEACARDATGRTPLHYAARNGHAEAVRLLLRASCECAALVDARGCRALHAASSGGGGGGDGTRCIELLCHWGGADPLLEDKSGGNSIHAAMDCRAVKALRLLRRHVTRRVAVGSFCAARRAPGTPRDASTRARLRVLAQLPHAAFAVALDMLSGPPPPLSTPGGSPVVSSYE